MCARPLSPRHAQPDWMGGGLVSRQMMHAPPAAIFFPGVNRPCRVRYSRYLRVRTCPRTSVTASSRRRQRCRHRQRSKIAEPSKASSPGEQRSTLVERHDTLTYEWMEQAQECDRGGGRQCDFDDGHVPGSLKMLACSLRLRSTPCCFTGIGLTIHGTQAWRGSGGFITAGGTTASHQRACCKAVVPGTALAVCTHPYLATPKSCLRRACMVSTPYPRVLRSSSHPPSLDQGLNV